MAVHELDHALAALIRRLNARAEKARARGDVDGAERLEGRRRAASGLLRERRRQQQAVEEAARGAFGDEKPLRDGY